MQLPGDFPRGGSHGFNVRAANSGVNYFMTASHVVNETMGVNGLTGAAVYQPSYAGGVIGQIAVNTEWQEAPALECQGFDYCTTADVALGTFSGSVSGERKIGVSVTEGSVGNPGSNAISNWYNVAGTVAPEFIQNYRNIVHKSGYKTGTTTGGIDMPCAYAPADVQIGLAIKKLLLRCHVRVAFAGHGKGDSGGVVFARMTSGGPYYALGILASGGPVSDDDVCTAGAACNYMFAQWSAIEASMGVGPLNPATTQ